MELQDAGQKVKAYTVRDPAQPVGENAPGQGLHQLIKYEQYGASSNDTVSNEYDTFQSHIAGYIAN